MKFFAMYVCGRSNKTSKVIAMKLKLIFHLTVTGDWLDALFIAHFWGYEQFQDAISPFFYSPNISNLIIEIFSNHQKECSLSLHYTFSQNSKLRLFKIGNSCLKKNESIFTDKLDVKIVL